MTRSTFSRRSDRWIRKGQLSPWVAALPSGAYYTDLRGRASYMTNGPGNYEERGGSSNRKALEARFPERQAAGLASKPDMKLSHLALNPKTVS